MTECIPFKIYPPLHVKRSSIVNLKSHFTVISRGLWRKNISVIVYANKQSAGRC